MLLDPPALVVRHMSFGYSQIAEPKYADDGGKDQQWPA
jgi:hypothetical protein